MNSIWRNRNFCSVWAAQAISSLGTRLGREALPLGALILLGAGPMQLGLLNALQSVPALFLGLFAGAWMERRKRLPVMIGSDFLRALLLLSVPAMAFIGLLSMTQLYLVVLAVAALTFLFDVADQTLLPEIVSEDEIVAANGAKDGANAAAEIVGPALGGILVTMLSAPIAILIDALSFLASGLILRRMRRDETRPEAQSVASAGRIANEIHAGLMALWRHDIIRPLIFAKSLRALFGGMISAFYVFYVVMNLGLTPAMMGIIVGCGGAAALAGAALAPILSRHIPVGYCLMGALVLVVLGISCLALASATSGPVLLVLLLAHQLLADSALTFFVVLERSLRQRLMPQELQARSNSTVLMLAMGPAPVGALLGGLLAERVGLEAALFVAAAGYGLSFAVIAGSKTRSLPRF